MKKKGNDSKKKISARDIKKLKVNIIKKKEEPEIKKEETLEEYIEDSEIFETAELPQFVSTPLLQNVSAPVLEKIKIEEEADLESNIISTPISRTARPEGVEVNYSANQNYMASSYSETGRGYEQVEIISPILERTRASENVSRKELLNWQDVQPGERAFVEIPERANIRNVEERRKLPFERTEKKYKEMRR